MPFSHPLLNGEFLFIINNCPHCKMWKKFIHQMNQQFKPDKRIEIIDCTNFIKYGIVDNPIILLFDRYIDGYPVLFIRGSRKDGANSVTECKQWLRIKKFEDFYFSQENKLLPKINKYEIFVSNCKTRKGRLICKDGEEG